MAVAGQRILVQARLEFDPMRFEEAEPFANYGFMTPRRTLELFQPERTNEDPHQNHAIYLPILKVCMGASIRRRRDNFDARLALVGIPKQHSPKRANVSNRATSLPL